MKVDVTRLGLIVDAARQEVSRRQRSLPLAEVQARARDAGPAHDLAAALTAGPTVALIAEIKRASPTAGPLLGNREVKELARAYRDGGARALSVVTEGQVFGGDPGDLREARDAGGLPVLRKDFIVDPYQIVESRALGADAALLIAAIIPEGLLADYVGIAAHWGLTPLVEVHSIEELERAEQAGARCIGINNRDLRTFAVSLQTTLSLAPRVGKERLVISESGIRTAADVRRVARAGAHAVLVGEALLRARSPQEKARQLAGVRRDVGQDLRDPLR